VNKVSNLHIVAVFGLFLSAITAQANVFLTVAQDGVDKIRSKPIAYKPSLEFKQAVARYIKNTDTHFYQMVQRTADENVSYKKELQYLFKNYSKLSSAALLSRLRSAHQTMVKQDTHVDGEAYKKYEQICSALLLTCTQVFFNDMRNQILNALHEIDTLMVYWRYQQNHQLKYFFSKSPAKWIFGKEQSKEIAHNLIRLERKQTELYTLLGALTGHVHSFTEVGLNYEDCYTWIERLFEMISYLKTSLPHNTDGSRFDTIAATLELKVRRVSSFKNDCLSSVAAARKPNHFIRHWLKYAVLSMTAGYAAHFYLHNSLLINNHVIDKLALLRENWTGLVVKPSQDLWNTIFGESEQSTIRDSATDLMKDIENLEINEGVNKKTCNELKEFLKVDRANTQKGMLTLLKKKVAEGKLTQDQCDKMINAEKIGDVTPFQDFFYSMDKDLMQFYWEDDIVDAIVVLAELKIYHYGSSLIQIVFELIVNYGIPVVKEVLAVLAEGNKEWASACKKVNLILNVAVLTPTIIVGLTGCNGLYKTYRWATTRDYSSIRIGLADINSLLIEAANNLDDHDYGKLVYLICKLKDRATYLKDPMTDEFLADVAKLESKQYSAHIKRGIVENMFNKYAFLGRIAIA